MNKPIRTRFAPSPTGAPHIGVFRTALFSWLFARHHGGQFILRVEDTDQARVVPGSLENIILSMQTLGMMYDEGPDKASVAKLNTSKYGSVNPDILPSDGGKYGSYFQSQRLERYDELLAGLIDNGKAYYAFETPEEMDRARDAAKKLNKPYQYDRKFRDYDISEAKQRVANGEKAVIRLKIPTEGKIITPDFQRGDMEWDATTQDDLIIRKADGFPTYHFAAMVDDHDMEISHVLRGDEWLSTFPKHICLFNALGWEPPVFLHAPSVLAPGGGKKLSKRHGAKPITGPAPELEDGKMTGDTLPGLVNNEGFLPDALVNFLVLIGWAPGNNQEIMTRDEMITLFSLEAISTSPAAFDAEKMAWMNGMYLRELTPEALVEKAIPHLVAAGLIPENPDAATCAYAAQAIALEHERIRRLGLNEKECAAWKADRLAEAIAEDAANEKKKGMVTSTAWDALPVVADFFFPLVCAYNTKSVEKWVKPSKDYLTDVLAGIRELDTLTLESIEAVVRGAGEKNNRTKGDVTHPVRVAVTGREKGPGLFDAMAVLGKERLIARLEAAIAM
jgi:glutamyl-tRNA synthetase